jgi:hypothetical protein
MTDKKIDDLNNEVKTEVKAKSVNDVSAMSVDEVSAFVASGNTLETDTIFDPIQVSLGKMWAHTLVYGTSADVDNTTALWDLKTARNAVIAAINDNSVEVAYDTQTDASMTLSNTLRTIEKALPLGYKNLVSGVCTPIDTAILAITGVKTKAWFNTSPNAMATTTEVFWDNDFRALWRAAKNEELIVPVFQMKKPAGAWVATGLATPTIVYNGGTFDYNDDPDTSGFTCSVLSALEIRKVTCVSTPISITSITFYTSGDPTPANRSESTITYATPLSIIPSTTTIALDNSAVRYTGVKSITCTGGSENDEFQVWIK